MPASHATLELDHLDVAFDDRHAVANAGLLLAATLTDRLGIAQAADEHLRLQGPGAANPGAKLLTLVHGMLAGGDCIDDVDVLRCGATASVLGHRVMAPSTVGTFLRCFTFGHTRQLDHLTEQALTRAWAAGAGPGDAPVTIDADSTIIEVHGYHKQGASYGYTRKLGYHPLLATRADTGEVLHARPRTGRAHTARGMPRFIDELVARVRRAGASGELTVRADSGFWSAKTIKRLRRHRVRYSITVRHTKPIRAAIAAIADDAWTDICYPDSGIAQVAETRYRGDRLIGRRVRHLTDQGQGEIAQVAETRYRGDRLIVRRVRHLTDQGQGELFPTWEYHAFVTDRVGTAVELDHDHRRHAVVEMGQAHCPYERRPSGARAA